MEIQDFLSRTDTVVNVRASDKAGSLQELSRQAAARLNLRADLISGDILKCEDLGSTGMGNGVAIPHARIPNLKKPFGGPGVVGTSKNTSYSSDATKLSANDSASFPFRFIDVHAGAARDPYREQFFEVPLFQFGLRRR